MQPLKRNLLSMALASATLMLANAAYAQSADQSQPQSEADDLDAIEVVGIRRSIQDSTDAKRESTSIVEAIEHHEIEDLVAPVAGRRRRGWLGGRRDQGQQGERQQAELGHRSAPGRSIGAECGRWRPPSFQPGDAAMTLI